jgi:hypothetical protein
MANESKDLGILSSNKTAGAPYLARFSRDAPDFLLVALDKTACAPFFKERRMKFVEPTDLHRKSGMWDTTAVDLQTLDPKGHLFGEDGCPTFAPAYVGRKRSFSNAFT